MSASTLESELDAARSMLQSDPAEGAVALNGVKARAVEANDPATAGQAAYALARDAVNQAEPERALALISEAQDFFVAAGDNAFALRSELGRMHALDDLGLHAEAVEVGRSLITRLDLSAGPDDAPSGEERDWLRAAAEENLGVALGYMGSNHQALEAYANAAGLYRHLGQRDDMARVTANRGVELLHLGQASAAIADLTDAKSTYEDEGDELAAAKCAAFVATARLQLGDYDRAMNELAGVRHDLEGLNASAEILRTRVAIADAYASANLHAEASVIYSDVADRCVDAGMEHDAATARYGLASALAKDGQPELATLNFELAEQGFERVGNKVMHARSRLERAHLLGPVDAVELTRKAVADLRGLDRPVELALGQLHLASLAPDESATLIAEAEDIVESIALPHLQWRLLHAQAQQCRRIGAGEKARELLEAAIDIISAMRDRVGADGARLSFLQGRDQVYVDLIDTYLEQGRLRSAYALADAWRAPTLLDRMDGRVAASAVREASAELNSVYGQISAAPTGAVDTLRTRARELERQLDLNHGERRPTRSEMVQRVSPTVHPVITYQLIGDEIVAFVECGEDIEVVRSMSSAKSVSLLLEQLEQHNAWLAGGLLGTPQVTQLAASARDLARSLYEELLDPLLTGAVFDALVATERLTVVPQGVLSRVPFGALHDGRCHLIERCAVDTIPSRAAAVMLQGTRNAPDFSTLVFAVGDSYIGHVDTEADAVVAMSPRSEVRRNDRASVDDFKRLASHHDVLHVSCHGIHRPDSPWFSALKFGDGWLTASEVGGLDLSGQLVVLSACESGRQSIRGSELLGLPWGFLAAGAAATVVNLWPTDDQSAAALMSAFYRHLVQDCEATDALRSAQLEVLEQRPHPYFWASTTIVGGIQ